MNLDDILSGQLKDQASRELAWAFLKALKTRATERPKPTHGQLRRFTTYTRHYECQHCGTRWISQCEVGKGEYINVLDHEGKVTTMSYRGEKTLTVKSYCSRCEHCRRVIGSWSRERLEAAYIHLLSRLAYGETHVDDVELVNCGLQTAASHDTVAHPSGTMPEQLPLWENLDS